MPALLHVPVGVQVLGRGGLHLDVEAAPLLPRDALLQHAFDQLVQLGQLLAGLEEPRGRLEFDTHLGAGCGPAAGPVEEHHAVQQVPVRLLSEQVADFERLPVLSGAADLRRGSRAGRSWGRGRTFEAERGHVTSPSSAPGRTR